jgi:hypothetical protein
MLVIGGAGSLTGAVVDAVAISALTEALREAEVGFSIGRTHLAAPAGLDDSALALLMLIIILYRPKGIARCREMAFLRDARPWPDATTPRRHATPPRTANSNRPMDDTPPPPGIDPSALSEIAKGVFVIGDRRVPLVPNIGIVLGDDAPLVIDTGMGARKWRQGAQGRQRLSGAAPADPDPHSLPSGARLRGAGFQGRSQDHLQRSAAG